MAKVVKTDNCWLWQGAIDPVGRGVFRTGSKHDKSGRTQRASRIAFELFIGPIPKNLIVCHRCDNPRCVRPDHLFLGTDADNVHDAMAKGRNVLPTRPPRGSEHHLAKLTDERVREIRRLASEGGSPGAMARQFGVARSQIYRVIHRQAWQHVE